MSEVHKYPYEAQQEINDLQSQLEEKSAQLTFMCDAHNFMCDAHKDLIQVNEDDEKEIENLEKRLAGVEKLLVEAHWLRFDSFLSDVQDFNERNEVLINELQVKHKEHLTQLKEKGDE